MNPHTSPTARSRTGFTLVELLVVIGIIAVLISILLPALSNARRSAYTAKCASNMRQIALGVIQYANLHKGRLMPSRVMPHASNTVWPDGFFWANELARLKIIPSSSSQDGLGRLVTVSTVFKCPEGENEIDPYTIDLRSSDATHPTDNRNNMSSRYRYGEPSIATWYMLNAKFTASVTANGALKDTPFLLFLSLSTNGNRNINADLSNSAFTRSMSQVRRTAEMAMLLEGSEAQVGLSWKFIAGRHGTKANGGRDASTNIAYFDGHVALKPTLPFTRAAAASSSIELSALKNDTIFYMSSQR